MSIKEKKELLKVLGIIFILLGTKLLIILYFTAPYLIEFRDNSNGDTFILLPLYSMMAFGLGLLFSGIAFLVVPIFIKANVGLQFISKKNILKIKVLYRGKWYYASSVSINREGFIDVEYCHDLGGCVDTEHIKEIKLEAVE